MNPPVPGVDAFKNVSGDTHMALPVLSMICCSERSSARSRSGSTCTCSRRCRSPQIETFATPGTPIKRGTIVQRARTDIWMSERSVDDSPICMTRLVDDRGCSITGGLDTCGSPPTRVRRRPPAGVHP